MLDMKLKNFQKQGKKHNQGRKHNQGQKMEISSLIMEIMREKNIMRDRKWNFPPCFCIIRDRKCQKQGRKITFLGIFFPRRRKKTRKRGRNSVQKERNNLCYRKVIIFPFSLQVLQFITAQQTQSLIKTLLLLCSLSLSLLFSRVHQPNKLHRTNF